MNQHERLAVPAADVVQHRVQFAARAGVRDGAAGAEARRGEHGLHGADPPLAEAALAVGEVQLPQAPEAAVVAQRLESLGAVQEGLAPAPQRLGVVRGDVLEVEHAQVGGARHAARDHLERWQAAGREDQLADERARGLLHLVGAVVDHDRLQQHAPARVQQPGAGPEEGLEVLVAHRLHHLHRDELVEAPAQVAIVAHQHLHAVGEPGLAHPRAGHGVLLGGDGGGGHAAAVVARGVKRERAPARADLDHVVARVELELAADAVELRQLRLLE